MLNFLRKSRAFLLKDLLIDLSYRLAFWGQMVSSLMTILAFYFFSSMLVDQPIASLDPYGGKYFPFVLIGLSFSSYLATAIHSFSETIRNAQVLGTLEALLTTPTPAGQIVILNSLYAFVATSFRVFLVLFFGVVFFGVELSFSNWAAILLVFGLSIVSFSFLGVLSAAFVLVFKRADPSGWVVEGLSYLFGGVYYPLAILPDWCQSLADFLPITHSLEAMRLLLLTQASFSDIQGALFSLALFSVIAGPISVGAFLWALRWVMKDGSLNQF
jgi:ABC-2 type transport system permease protein